MDIKVKKVPCFSVTAQDRPGRLAAIVRGLTNRGVALDGLWSFSIGEGKAWIIIVPKDAGKFKDAAFAEGIESADGMCFRIDGSDELTPFCDLLEAIASRKLNVHALDAIIVDGKFGCYLWSEGGEFDSLSELLGV